MNLTTNVSVPKFDSTVINRGDGIRIRRATESTPINGIVTRLTDTMLEILVNAPQGNSTRFLQLAAGDVAIGVYEVWWTTDFVTINYSPPATVGGDSSGS